MHIPCAIGFLHNQISHRRPYFSFVKFFLLFNCSRIPLNFLFLKRSFLTQLFEIRLISSPSVFPVFVFSLWCGKKILIILTPLASINLFLFLYSLIFPLQALTSNILVWLPLLFPLSRTLFNSNSLSCLSVPEATNSMVQLWHSASKRQGTQTCLHLV